MWAASMSVLGVMHTMSFWTNSSLQLSGGVQASMPQYKYNAQSCSIILVIRAYVSLRNLSIHKPVICPTCCRFGNTVIVHFEDMAHANLDRLLSQYRGTLPCFSDDVQVRLNRSLPTLVACLTLHGFFLHGICGCL